uniref:glucosidase 2 subunit beta isoform X2 n=1 Tax=Ciona intestinalis TaxID=7719 RepID=UPI000052137D|nr:glucosidase 2 subunit beta isoform X2 [Ciona intestinalis]|eukprot:XP_026691367.1 glucosidase 2 subunit beta isoform X2 [Ciona intestinalis]
MRLLFFFISTLHAVTASEFLQAERLRGVSLTKTSLYNPAADFTCFDGSKSVKFALVNDDYCDCPDGSDEPGTSACPNGSFHCTNAGYRPTNIPSSRVNDGICDCCDGSDEWKHPNICQNNCVELWKLEKARLAEEEDQANRGFVLRQEFSKTGISKKVERQQKVEELEAQLVTLKEKEVLLKTTKEEIEAKEAAALEEHKQMMEEKRAKEEHEENMKRGALAFSELDADKDAVVTGAELTTHKELDPELSDETFTDTEAQQILQADSVDLGFFLTNVWPTINSTFQTTIPPIVEQQEEKSQEQTQETPPPPPSAEYSEETQRIVEEAMLSRETFRKHEDERKNIESEIQNLKTALEMDFGPDESYQALQFQCYELQTMEYTYKLCPFDKTSQSPKNGGTETNLGRWGSWSGGNDDKYSKMKYDNGLTCWNGPARSTEVRIKCGVEHKLLSVDEPSRCAYTFEFATPCACKQTQQDSQPRDEL